MQILSKAQIDFFFREGYVIVKDVYSKEEIEYLRNFFKEKFEINFWKISEYNSPTIINDIYRHFPELVEIIFKPVYIDAVKNIFETNLICIPECCIHHNRFYDWHRDTTLLESTGEKRHRLGTNYLVQSCVYLQDNSPEGGGLTLVPGSQNKPDRFIKMIYGNYINRVYYKILKVFHRSTFHLIEKFENPIDIPTKAGDVLIFNNQLDHRATFLRGKNSKPVHSSKEKFAIFNTFCNHSTLASLYLQSLKVPEEDYAKFLRQSSLAPALIKKSEELNFSLCDSIQ